VPACADCPPPPVAWARAALLYEGPVRRGLMRLKFSGWRSAARSLAPWMVEAFLGDLPVARPPGTSVVTWVPLGRRRRGDRGFDQAEALARAVAAEVGWPARRLLDRVVETSPQARRGGAQRREALRGAFRARPRIPPWVVLVDDVLTSGATTAECARVLMGAGAREVGVLCAARALGGPVPARCYTPLGLRPGSVVARETSSR
jgi:predicted amidophosphoribosyltransferase